MSAPDLARIARSIAAETRRAQGLGEHVTDVPALTKVATLVSPTDETRAA